LKILVYDLPTRLFHWIFASLFLTAFTIAKTTDDESIVFSYHMLLGLLLGGLVIWRIIWGFIGSRYARFSSFALSPVQLKDYFFGILTGSKKRWAGHNPASSWAALAMLLLAFGLAVTGYLMVTGSKETFEDFHEFLANMFMIIAVFHVSGVIFHSMRFKDQIALSMVTGKKDFAEPELAVKSSRSFAAIVLLALVFSGGIYLFKGFNSNNGELLVLGQTLQIGEGNGHDESHKIKKEKHKEKKQDHHK